MDLVGFKRDGWATPNELNIIGLRKLELARACHPAEVSVVDEVMSGLTCRDL
jgi:ABC-type branched-subunit amino acid transport system ATPase component